MFEFKKIILGLFAVLLSGDLASGAGLSDLTLIRDIKLLSNPEEIRVLVITDGKPVHLPSIKAIDDRLLQLDITKSYTEPSKRSFSIDDVSLEKIDIYQFDEQTVRVRLHTLTPFEKEGSKTWNEKEGFVLSLKRKPIVGAEKIQNDEAKVPVRDDREIEDSFPAIFYNPEAKSDGNDVTVTVDDGNIGLNPIIKMASSLALVVGLFLMGAYVFKKKLLDKGPIGKGDLIRVLERGFIDIKKGVAIVDVAGEVLVLGISGENITLLTKLESEQALERLKPFYKGKEKQTFSDAYKKMVSGMNEGSSESVVDKIRKLKPLK